MENFQTLTEGSPTKVNPKLTALRVSLAQVETDIGNLINTLSGANSTLISYANTKIDAMDAERQSLMKQIADLTAESVSPECMEHIAGHLNNWDNVSFEDRMVIADGMLSVIRAVKGNIQIEWKIYAL